MNIHQQRLLTASFMLYAKDTGFDKTMFDESELKHKSPETKQRSRAFEHTPNQSDKGKTQESSTPGFGPGGHATSTPHAKSQQAQSPVKTNLDISIKFPEPTAGTLKMLAPAALKTFQKFLIQYASDVMDFSIKHRKLHVSQAQRSAYINHFCAWFYTFIQKDFDRISIHIEKSMNEHMEQFKKSAALRLASLIWSLS